MSFNPQHRSRKPLLLLLVPLVLFVGVVIAATLLTTNFSVTVSPPTGVLTAVTMGSQTCPTANSGTSATCSSITLGFGTSEILTVKIQGSPTAPVLVSANSNPSGVVSITPGSNPSALDGAGLATFTFTITGVATGSTSVTVTLSI